MIGGRARDPPPLKPPLSPSRPSAIRMNNPTQRVAQATRLWFRATRPKPLPGKLPGRNGQVARATPGGLAASRLCVKSAIRNWGATPLFAPPPSRRACLVLTPERLAYKRGLSREKCRKRKGLGARMDGMHRYSVPARRSLPDGVPLPQSSADGAMHRKRRETVRAFCLLATVLMGNPLLLTPLLIALPFMAVWR